MVAEYESAPNFEVLDDQNRTVQLSDYQGKWVVLYFFPKAMTPGWTIQAQGIRDDFAKFEEIDAVILGASPDSVKRQAKFKAQEDLPFVLLADENHQIADQYGVWQEKKMMGKTFMGVVRTTFLIDPAGQIAKVFPNVSPKEHSQQVLDALGELQTG